MEVPSTKHRITVERVAVSNLFMGNSMPEPLKHIKDYLIDKPQVFGKMLIHKPLKKREEKSMTIAVGAIAADGILIAADTEVNDTVNKTKQSKILWMRSQVRLGDFSMIVTGSGDLPYLRILAQKIKDGLAAHKIDLTFDKVEVTIAEIIHKFFSDHVFPMNNPAFDEPSLIIGCQYPAGVVDGNTDYIPQLWKSSRSAIALSGEFAAVGVGKSEAINSLYHLRGPRSELIPIKQLVPMMIYAISRVKDVVPGCGNDTYICCSINGKPLTVNFDYINTLEAFFESDGLDLERDVASWLFDNDKDFKGLSRSLKKAKKLIHEMEGDMWIT